MLVCLGSAGLGPSTCWVTGTSSLSKASLFGTPSGLLVVIVHLSRCPLILGTEILWVESVLC